MGPCEKDDQGQRWSERKDKKTKDGVGGSERSLIKGGRGREVEVKHTNNKMGGVSRNSARLDGEKGQGRGGARERRQVEEGTESSHQAEGAMGGVTPAWGMHPCKYDLGGGS